MSIRDEFESYWKDAYKADSGVLGESIKRLAFEAYQAAAQSKQHRIDEAIEMKENLRVEVRSKNDHLDAAKLVASLDLPCVIYDENYLYASSFNPQIPCREITLPELRELARPKEYLNEKFELVVTNQPSEGWLLVPDGADIMTCANNTDYYVFWKTQNNTEVWLKISQKWELSHKDAIKEYIAAWNGNVKTLWQRNPKESEMNTEKKGREENAGRFLHQWAYEAFGRGEDVQMSGKYIGENVDFTLEDHVREFNNLDITFHLKPQTIQIGSRTINKPISVKPEIGTDVFVASLSENKVFSFVWADYVSDHWYLENNLCHLTANDAINMTDAILELMKVAK